jgi:DNA-binding GntR family transcriptional regulator
VAQEDMARQLGVSIAPLREALRTLEQEGQVTYLPRRGYFIAALEIADLEEIYALRAILEERAARHALGTLDGDALERVLAAARDCADAVNRGDVTAEIEANRRFHFAILQSPGQPHTLRLIRLLWDSTEAYRALYYNSEPERRASLRAHERIVKALRRRDADRLVAELGDHRERALTVLRGLLGPATPGTALVGEPRRLVLGVEWSEGHHRAEHLVAEDLHLRAYLGDDGGLTKKPRPSCVHGPVAMRAPCSCASSR